MTKDEARVHAAAWAATAVKLSGHGKQSTHPQYTMMFHCLALLAENIGRAYADMEQGLHPITGEPLNLSSTAPPS